MVEQSMAFQVGDQVVHWVYGLGEIIQLDEKVLSGESSQYYVVQIRDLTLWVPLNEAGENCLRLPTQAKDFQNMFDLLSSPAESIPPDRHARKTQLTELLKDGTLASICRVVRDLTCYKQSNRINEMDNTILERARNFLVTEWSVALSITARQAERELGDLLEKSVVQSS